MSDLETLDAEYREVSRRFRESHGPEDGDRLREIRKEIKTLVEAETNGNGQVRSEAASSSEARRHRRYGSAAWQLDHEVRECEGCGASFQPTDSRQLFCSPECGSQHRRYRNAHDLPVAVDQGGQDGVHEPLGEAVDAVTNGGFGTCNYCGAGPLPAKRSTRKFCSDGCKQAAYRERKASEL